MLQGAAAAAPGARGAGSDAGSDSDDELFVPRQSGRAGGGAGDAEDPEAPDTVREAFDEASLAAWGDPGATERLRDRFVTGVQPRDATLAVCCCAC